MTVHPYAVVATLIVLALSLGTTLAVRRLLRARRGGPARNDQQEWSILSGVSMLLYGTAAFLLVNALGLRR